VKVRGAVVDRLAAVPVVVIHVVAALPFLVLGVLALLGGVVVVMVALLLGITVVMVVLLGYDGERRTTDAEEDACGESLLEQDVFTSVRRMDERGVQL
jgi:hypothetical protein